MKALKITGIALAVVIIILAITIVFLSPKSHMERSVMINSQPAIIYDLLDNFKNYNNWSPWAEVDPDTQYSYSGPESGPGARMTWSSKNDQVGNGEQWIIETRENEYIKYGMKFGDLEGVYFAEMILKPAENGTQVTWTYNGDVSNESAMNAAMGKFFGMFMDSMLGPFYEKGLSSLKEISESTPPTYMEPAADTSAVIN